MIAIADPPEVAQLLEHIRGHEIEMIMDIHASHVIQKVIMEQPPSIFGSIINRITSREKDFKKVILDKSGCRVVQMCLDRIVLMCQKSNRRYV